VRRELTCVGAECLRNLMDNQLPVNTNVAFARRSPIRLDASCLQAHWCSLQLLDHYLIDSQSLPRQDYKPLVWVTCNLSSHIRHDTSQPISLAIACAVAQSRNPAQTHQKPPYGNPSWLKGGENPGGGPFM